MCLYQTIEFRVLHQSVVEIGSQCQENDERTSRFCGSGQQQVDEASPLVFGFRLRKEFLKLIYEQYHGPHSPPHTVPQTASAVYKVSIPHIHTTPAATGLFRQLRCQYM